MKRRISKFLAMTLLVGMMTGCTSTKSAGENNDEKSVTFGSIGYFCNENMDAGESWNGWYIGYYGLSENLFKLNDNFEAEELLVDSYENTDENTWKFTLKENVNFHNGEKMDAEAVKACFERTIEVNERAADIDTWLDSIEADGQVLTIKTKKVVADLPNTLADPMWNIYYAQGNEDNYDEISYFTGPYKLESFSANDETVVVKNEDYWNGEAKLDKAVFKTLADTESLVMALQNDEVQVAVPLLSSGIETLKNDDNFTIDGATSTRGQFLTFNMESEVVQDVAVRNAISMAIDRENYCKVTCSDTAVPSYGIYTESLPYGGTEGLNLTVDKYDLDGAKKLLEEAGYKDTNNDGTLDKDGVELTINLVIASNQDDMLKLCEDLQSKLKEIGINFKVNAQESINDSRENGNYDMSCETYGMAPTGSSQYFIDLMFTSNGSYNYGKYSNSKVDELAVKLSTTTDEDEKIKITKEIEQEILNDCGFIFFAHKKFTCVYSNKVTGFKTSPTEYYCLDADTDITE